MLCRANCGLIDTTVGGDRQRSDLGECGTKIGAHEDDHVVACGIEVAEEQIPKLVRGKRRIAAGSSEAVRPVPDGPGRPVRSTIGAASGPQALGCGEVVRRHKQPLGIRAIDDDRPFGLVPGFAADVDVGSDLHHGGRGNTAIDRSQCQDRRTVGRGCRGDARGDVAVDHAILDAHDLERP